MFKRQVLKIISSTKSKKTRFLSFLTSNKVMAFLVGYPNIVKQVFYGAWELVWDEIIS